MLRFASVLVTCLLVGCSTATQPSTDGQDPSTLPDIQRIVAKQLGKNPTDVDPESTFSGIGADDLDLIEIMLEVEDTFGVTVQDGALVAAAGIADSNLLCNHLTVRAFARVAESSPKQRDDSAPADDEIDDGNLHESQVGLYGELSALSNPNGLVLVFVPRFEEVVRLTEGRLGRKLREDEINALREKAAVVALPATAADEFERNRSSRKTKAGK